MRTIHRAWGEVTITARFSSHVNIMTTSGVHQCHPSELQDLPEVGEPLGIVPIVPTSTETETTELFYINVATPNDLHKKFGQLGKLKAKQITEKAPYESAKDMEEKLTHVFDGVEIIQTLAAQMRFDYPERQTSLAAPAADTPIQTG